jgi:hypothetical protein
MSQLAAKYAIPPEFDRFIDAGFLELLREGAAEKTVRFHIPSKVVIDTRDRLTAYEVFWIHPDFNAEFCHYCHERPGDLPNFWVVEDTDDVGDTCIDDLQTIDDLVMWLEAMQTADIW